MSLNFANTERFLEETRDASPTNLLIEFESFSSFAKYGIAQYESKIFEAGGYKWKMIMYPEGYESDKEGGCHVSVQFAIAETYFLPVGWNVEGTTRRFDALAPKCGFAKFIPKNTLIDPSKGYVVDDCCVFGAEVFVIKNQPVNGCLSLVKDMAPFKREWKVTGFSKPTSGFAWKSEQFKVGNHEWQVMVNPKIQSVWGKGTCMSVFVECVDAAKLAPRLKVKAEVCVRVLNKLNGTHDSFGFNLWFTSSCRSLGFPECLSNADMISKGYIFCDCCFVDVEICVHAVVVDEPKI